MNYQLSRWVAHGESLVDPRSMFRFRISFSGRRGSGQPWRLVLGHLRYVFLCVLPTRVSESERVRKRIGGTLVIGDLLSSIGSNS